MNAIQLGEQLQKEVKDLLDKYLQLDMKTRIHLGLHIIELAGEWYVRGGQSARTEKSGGHES